MTGSFEELLARSAIDRSELFPYAKLAPKAVWVGTLNEWGQPQEGQWDKSANLEFRRWLDKRGEEDKQDRTLILDACAKDPLFFINAFLWIKQESPVAADLPFITWGRQEEYLRRSVELRRKVEADQTGQFRADLLTEKPREVGWTWLNLAEGFHIVRFTPGATCLVGSRVEYDVDKRGASKTLFWKLEYFIEHLPAWFMPDSFWALKGRPFIHRECRASLKLSIPGQGTMLGSATHENFGRSGRYQWMLPDEFAHVDRGQLGMGEKIWSATTATCRSRRPISTPNGRTNKFHDLRNGGSVEVFTVRWHDDPSKMVGAYKLRESMQIGPLSLKEGDWWSPWAEQTRGAYDNDALFAQEILLSYEGVGGCFYEGVLPKVKHEQVKKPVWSGNIKHSETGVGPRATALTRESPAYLDCWEHFGERNIWRPGDYVAGIDVASGSKSLEGRGASNSVIAVGRLEGKKLVKVAQYMTHGLAPHLFAKVVCALGWCFKTSDGLPAYCIWERNGPGEMMGNCLISEFHYPGQRAYWELSAVRGGLVPGFQMNTHRQPDGTMSGSKVNVFNEHLRWLELGLYEEPSHDTYREMEQYTYTEDAGAEHHRRKGSLDPSEGRDNHGDSVIATVLMIWAARELSRHDPRKTEEIQPAKLTLAWCQRKMKREMSKLWH